MHSRSTRIPRLAPCASLLAALALPGGAPLLHADGPVPAADIAPPEPGEITRTVINHGDHRTVLIELVPEALAPRAAAPARSSLPPAPAPSASASTATETPAKPNHVLFWSVSVLSAPAPWSVIQGQGSDQRPWRVFSNIDFRLLRPVSSFETALAAYDWIPAIGDADAQDPAMPSFAASGLSAAPAAYRVDPAGAAPAPEVLAALAYLHAHYTARHDELLAEFTRREAEAALRERELRENPPRKPDLVVRFSTAVARPSAATTAAR